MFLKNPLLFLACIFLILPSFIIAQDAAPVNCDANNRPEVCPFIFEPVCGWTGIQCLVAPCPEAHRDFGNGCEACSNQDILWYTPGECPDDGLGDAESTAEEGSAEEECVWEEANLPDGAIECDIPPGVAILCTADYTPVCAFPGGTTAGNACLACSAGAEYYFEGEC